MYSTAALITALDRTSKSPRLLSTSCMPGFEPDLITLARQRLARLGYHPTLVATDGAAGLVEHAPFDRIIAMDVAGRVVFGQPLWNKLG